MPETFWKRERLMESCVLGLLAETPVHVGAGSREGLIDLPVAREAATDYPVIPGSGFKGALRDLGRSAGWAEGGKLEKVFGERDGAGGLVVSDALLLLLPVRSLHGAFKWITCPHLIERLSRHRKRLGWRPSPGVAVERGKYLGLRMSSLILEERQFEWSGELPDGLLPSLAPLLAHEETAARLAERTVVLSDEDFTWFARYGLAVNARNKLDGDTKTTIGGALWYEETLPPDTVLFSVLADRSSDTALSEAIGLFERTPYIQVGANETVGQGILAVKVVEADGGGA